MWRLLHFLKIKWFFSNWSCWHSHIFLAENSLLFSAFIKASRWLEEKILQIVFHFPPLYLLLVFLGPLYSPFWPPVVKRRGPASHCCSLRHQPRRSTFKGFATHSSPAGDNKSLKIEVNATARGKRLKTDKSGLEIVSDFLILVLMETFSTSLRCPSKAEFRCYTSIFDGFILYSFGRWDRLATITAVKYERLSLLDQ